MVYINEKPIQKLYNDGLLNSFDYESYEKSETCSLGKMNKAPFTGHSERAKTLLELVHTEVCWSASIITRGNYQSFSRYDYFYPMIYKFESYEKLKEFQSKV